MNKYPRKNEEGNQTYYRDEVKNYECMSLERAALLLRCQNIPFFFIKNKLYALIPG